MHIQLNFGISLLGKNVATIFLDLDSSATLDLSLEAGANASISTSGDKSASAGVEGCVDLKGGFSANVGAKGSLLDLINADTQIPIFSKEFELFQVSLPHNETCSS